LYITLLLLLLFSIHDYGVPLAKALSVQKNIDRKTSGFIQNLTNNTTDLIQFRMRSI